MFSINTFAIVQTVGYAGLAGIIFAESGLLVGFFLPGDSLLFTAGLIASQHILNIWILMPVFFFAAVAGDNLGYFLGRRFGPAIFNREDSFFFRKSNVERARAFFATYGSKAVILARFVPVVRTFTPILAGVGEMPYKKYFFFDFIGGFLWAVAIPVLGYYLGSRIPNIDRYIIPVVALVVVFSFIPMILEFYRIRRKK